MSSRRKHGGVCGLVLFTLFATDAVVVPASAQELLGAKEAMQQVRGQAEKEAPAKDSSKLRKTIHELPKKLEALAPAEAAATWLAVYDEWLAESKDARAGHHELPFSELFNVLPAPAAWPELVRLIEARPVEGNNEAQIRSLALRMLGHRLTNRTELLKQDVERALKLVETPKKAENKGGLGALIGRVFRGSDRQDYWKQNLQHQLAIVKEEFDPLSAIEQFRKELESQDSDKSGYVAVPDLVSLIGREAAIPLLEKALRLKNVSLRFSSHSHFNRPENETVKLARELARQLLKELTQPHWELCHSIDAIDLFEAFAAMPKPAESRFRFRQDDEGASTWYVVGLIVHDRPKDVLKFMTESRDENADARQDSFARYLSHSILPQLERAGHSQKVRAFLVEALKTQPELPLWDIFVELSARLGQNQQMLTMVDEALANEKLSPTTRRNIERVRADALLSADRVDEGVAQSLTLLAAEAGGGDDRQQGRSRLELALRVAEIGRLMERDEWLRQGTDIAEKLLSDQPQDGSGDIGELVGLLIEVGQLARAERLIIGALAKQTANEEEENERHRFLGRSGYGNGSPLEHLLRVYHKAGRAADVITLLEEAPWWSQTDVSQMLVVDHSLHAGHGERPTVPVPLIAARSLAAVGRKDEARKIATAMVLKWPSFDPGWQLALELTGDEFMPLAEQAFALDRFEERPLIWQARFQLDRGNVAKAEELARQAIAIDPSDGEQGRGDRMRVYAVLAEVLTKQGDAKTATIYEGAVKAIRLAEQADQFYHAGLLGRGIRMYRASLTHFADAYCVQSRLAVQLAQAGDLEAASQHYQRAFELMPDSFGRVESHCFGCEGVFQGQVAEKIAERVFLKLVADQPNNPRVHYLLGYLRESESRETDAVKSYREAVRLDPDYLNAWEKLLSSGNTTLTPKERDEATFQLLRLDPSSRHARADGSKIQDLAHLWTVLHDNARRVPTIAPSSLFELKAAKQERAAAEKLQAESGLDLEQFDQQSDRGVELSSHNILSAIAAVIQSAER